MVSSHVAAGDQLQAVLGIGFFREQRGLFLCLVRIKPTDLTADPVGLT